MGRHNRDGSFAQCMHAGLPAVPQYVLQLAAGTGQAGSGGCQSQSERNADGMLGSAHGDRSCMQWPPQPAGRTAPCKGPTCPCALKIRRRYGDTVSNPPAQRFHETTKEAHVVFRGSVWGSAPASLRLVDPQHIGGLR